MSASRFPPKASFGGLPIVRGVFLPKQRPYQRHSTIPIVVKRLQEFLLTSAFFCFAVIYFVSISLPLSISTMADNAAASTASTLPPAPQASTAASGQQYDASQGNGQANPSHMPPPPRPPVVIPQNTNPIPTAITSPMSGNMMSPSSAGGYVRRAAPEPNKRALYVGGLDPRVTEDILKQIFETTGHVVSVKIIPDKNVSRARAPMWLTERRFLSHYRTDTFRSSIAKDITMASLSSMTLVPLKEPCRLSTAAESTSRYA